MTDLLTNLLEKLIQLFTGLRRLRVRVHKAYFTRTDPRVWAYFINVTNTSCNRELEITHVWLDTVPPVFALPPDRPLPKRLKPDETWETWIERDRVPGYDPHAVYRLGRVRLSTGQVIRSVENKGIPPRGYIPGGPVTSYPDE